MAGVFRMGEAAVTGRRQPERWIVVNRWEEFQHYRDRRPTWVKVYTRLLHDHDYLALSAAARGFLQGLWIMYAETSGQLTYDDLRSTVARSDADRRSFKRSIESLSDAGFITVSASRPLAISYQTAISETETDTDKEQQQRARARARRLREPVASAAASESDLEEQPETAGDGGELDGLLSVIGVDASLARRARADGKRALAWASLAVSRDDVANPGGYFRAMFDKGGWPETNGARKPDPVAMNMPAKDPLPVVESMIRNGVLTDDVELQGEIDGYGLQAYAVGLRELLREVQQ